jgi:hypothetical protein
MPRAEIHRKYALSKQRRDLLGIMQRINFGRIEGLTVRSGEPTFDPIPRIIQEIKLGGEDSPRMELEQADFELKAQVVELFQYMTKVGNGSIACLDVKHGLPFRIVVEQEG